MNLKIIKNNRGVSVIELLVATMLFTVIVVSTTEIFKMVIDGQRNAISAQNIQENMRYAFEKMSKEIRMATISNADCLPGATNKVFNTAGGDTQLYLKNKDGQCVNYYLENNRLKIQLGTGGTAVSDFITPGKIQVSNLHFYVVDDLIGSFHDTQPYITMVMDVKVVGLAIHEQKMKLQITVSSRYYE